jgi:hypothetical protein
MSELVEDVKVEWPNPWADVVVFTGEHDLLTRDQVSDLLDSLVDQCPLVVADFSEAKFVDSAMLHVLFQTHAQPKHEEAASGFNSARHPSSRGRLRSVASWKRSTGRRPGRKR